MENKGEGKEVEEEGGEGIAEGGEGIEGGERALIISIECTYYHEG